MNSAKKCLSHKHVGLKILAKIKIYILARAEYFALFAMRYPVLQSFPLKSMGFPLRLLQPFSVDIAEKTYVPCKSL